MAPPIRGLVSLNFLSLSLSICPSLTELQKYRNTEIITVRVLDEAQHCGEALLTLEVMVRSRVAISYDSVGFYHIACGV